MTAMNGLLEKLQNRDSVQSDLATEIHEVLTANLVKVLPKAIKDKLYFWATAMPDSEVSKWIDEAQEDLDVTIIETIKRIPVPKRWGTRPIQETQLRPNLVVLSRSDVQDSILGVQSFMNTNVGS